MFQKTILGVLCISLPLSGCTGLFLPPFNGGVLNPDIRFLRAGEVMNSTKCAMIAFLKERDKQLMAERVKIYRERAKDPRQFLLYYSQEYPKNFVKDTVQPKSRQPTYTGADNEFRPWALNVTPEMAHLERCTPEDGDYFNPKKFRHLNLQNQCVLNNCPEQTLGIPIWDYAAKDGKNLAIEGGKRKLEGNCARIPDYSRFALDSTRSMTIELQLLANNTGTVNYQFIDATGLGALQEVIVTGSRSAGIPFPQFNTTMKGSNIFNMSAQMPQSLYIPRRTDKKPEAADKPKSSPPEEKKFNSREYRKSLSSLQEAIDKWQEKIPQTFNDHRKTSLDQSIEALIAALAAAKANIEKEPPAAGRDFAKVNELDDILRRALEAFIQAVRTANYNSQIRLAIEDDVEKQFQQMGYKHRGAVDFRWAEYSESPTQPSYAPSPPPASEEPGADLSSPAAKNAGVGSLSNPKAPGKDFLTRAEADLAETLTPQNQFLQGCGDGRYISEDDATEIDYLALKDLLLNLVNQQNDAVHLTGGPDVTLDALNLTTSFQIIVDTSAATRHIFRIFPLAIPPVMGVKPDHTHQLKITLQGPKKKGDPQNAQRLAKSCAERIARNIVNQGSTSDSVYDTTFCSSAEGILLESIVDALEQSRSPGQTP
jgi:hypothetical protein